LNDKYFSTPAALSSNKFYFPTTKKVGKVEGEKKEKNTTNGINFCALRGGIYFWCGGGE
jgi:hypothetical protein